MEVEAGVGLLQFFIENPIFAGLFSAVNTALVIGLWRDHIKARETLHKRISEHEVECARRWGRVEAKLEEIDRRNCT